METEWWQTAVIYQVYPRSFQDANGDGIGDLDGIRRRLDYLAALGVDAIWISPIYPSPMADFGYDVADYCDIDPLFGTLADFDAWSRRRTRAASKSSSISCRTIPRTSIPGSSRAARRARARNATGISGATRGPDGGPPNNWVSDFGGSAWELDETTGQYYYHAFLKEQPDLNWRNPEVREAMHDVLRFWLERGVDGFRVDVIWHLIKDDRVPRQPAEPRLSPGRPEIDRWLTIHTADRPEVHEVIAEMRAWSTPIQRPRA